MRKRISGKYSIHHTITHLTACSCKDCDKRNVPCYAGLTPGKPACLDCRRNKAWCTFAQDDIIDVDSDTDVAEAPPKKMQRVERSVAPTLVDTDGYNDRDLVRAAIADIDSFEQSLEELLPARTALMQEFTNACEALDKERHQNVNRVRRFKKLGGTLQWLENAATDSPGFNFVGANAE